MPDQESIANCDLCGSAQFEPYLSRAVDGRSLVRCRRCGLVFLNPRPNAHQIAEWYNADYFTGSTKIGMGADYLVHADAGIQHGTEAFFQFARRVRPEGLRILDVGCGNGAFLIQCRNAGANVAGLEISRFAAERLQQQGLDVRTGVIEAAPFDTASFDVVAFTDVVEHVPSPSAFFVGIRTLLRPGGKVYGLMPNLDCVTYYGTDWGGFQHHAEHLYYFGRDQLKQYLVKARLSPIEIWTWGEPWEPPAPGKSLRTSSRGQWRSVLRRAPGLVPAVRRLRRWRSRLKKDVRERESRYHQGMGHDLYFLAQRGE